MREGRSQIRIVHAALDVKSWIARLPSVEEVRPACCPCCRARGRTAGGGIILHGHGLRARHLWGPLEPEGPPVAIGVLTRRYRCQACGAVLVVVPQAVLRYRTYSASAIAWAFALFGIERRPPPEVRRRTSPQRELGFTAAAGWAALTRWAVAARAGGLMPGLPRTPARSRRGVAECVALALAGRVSPPWDLSPAVRAFRGAAYAA